MHPSWEREHLARPRWRLRQTARTVDARTLGSRYVVPGDSASVRARCSRSQDGHFAAVPSSLALARQCERDARAPRKSCSQEVVLPGGSVLPCGSALPGGVCGKTPAYIVDHNFPVRPIRPIRPIRRAPSWANDQVSSAEPSLPRFLTRLAVLPCSAIAETNHGLWQ